MSSAASLPGSHVTKLLVARPDRAGRSRQLKAQATQTTKESGSQHARTVQYVGGLRGNDFTTGAPVKLQYAKTAKATPGVVDLTYDLTSNLKPVAVGPSPGHLP